MSRSMEPAEGTPKEGIQSIDQILQDIESSEALRTSDFGKDVRRSLLDMKRGLDLGRFFSGPMERAIENWAKGVSGWLPKIDADDLQ